MHTITFSNNPIQKCTANIFADLRLFDNQKHIVGTLCEIQYRGKPLGTAEIKSFVCFHFGNINDTVSILSFNKNAAAAKAMLTRFYSDVNEKTVFAFIAFEWQTRNIEYQEELLHEWWNSQREAAHKNAQQSLFHNH